MLWYRQVSKSMILSKIYPPLVLLDFFLISIFLGWKNRKFDFLIFERYSLDVLVDLLIETKNFKLITSIWGKKLIEFQDLDNTILLFADGDTLSHRRKDLVHDKWLKAKLQIFNFLAKHFNLKKVNSSSPVNQTTNEIKNYLVDYV